MILRLNDAIPSIEGTPDECAEVIRQLNGGSVTVTVVIPPTVPSNFFAKEEESIKLSANMQKNMDACIDRNREAFDEMARSDAEPIETPITPPPERTPNRRTPKIPHSEDDWIATQLRDNVKVKEILLQLQDRGYSDITKNDVNNRCNYITKNTKRVISPPKFDADEYIREQRKRFVLPMEIAVALTRKTGDPWSTERVMAKISEMEVRPKED